MGPDWDRHWHSFFSLMRMEATTRSAITRGMKVMSTPPTPTP